MEINPSLFLVRDFKLIVLNEVIRSLTQIKFYRKNSLKVYNLLMKTKGFTLIETLLVTMLIGVLATVAITTYINSTATFQFLSSYQQVTSALRTARSNALSNEQQGGLSPKRYGVCISATGYATFAETGQKDFKIDFLGTNAADIALLAGCNNAGVYSANASGAQDSLLRDKTATISTQGYAIAVTDPSGVNTATSLPLLIFYENGTGNLIAYDSTGKQISKATIPYLGIKFSKAGGLTRYIRVYQVSGLAEESTTL